MINDPYKFENVAQLDYILYQLAMYEVTKGNMIVLDSIEDSFDLRKKTADKFNYFKKLIQNGTCSFDHIEETVLLRNGPFVQDGAGLSNEEKLNKTLDEIVEKDKQKNDDVNFSSDLYNLTYCSQIVKVLLEKLSVADRAIFLKMAGICDKCENRESSMPDVQPPCDEDEEWMDDWDEQL